MLIGESERVEEYRITDPVAARPHHNANYMLIGFASASFRSR
jgi:hypothetical protein